MSPKSKATEYLKEFSKEKSIDMANTMLWYAKEFKYSEWVDFWKKVIRILKSK